LPPTDCGMRGKENKGTRINSIIQKGENSGKGRIVNRGAKKCNLQSKRWASEKAESYGLPIERLTFSPDRKTCLPARNKKGAANLESARNLGAENKGGAAGGECPLRNKKVSKKKIQSNL